MKKANFAQKMASKDTNAQRDTVVKMRPSNVGKTEIVQKKDKVDDVLVSIRMEKEIKQMLKTASLTSGMSHKELIHNAFMEYVKNHNIKTSI